MTKQWQNWSERWETLSSREKFLLLATAITIPLVFIFIGLIEKPLQSVQKTPAQIEALEKEIVHQQRLLDVLKTRQVVDPNIAAREELKSLRLELSEQNKRIRRAATNLVSPEQMLQMLRSVLAEETDAKLITAKSLPVETVTLGNKPDANEDQADSTPQAVIFMHPFEIELEGSYQGVYDYLQRLEGLDGVFFWDLLDYRVEQHPTATIKLKVHTLSSEEGWLGA